jgi:hypothetical protein
VSAPLYRLPNRQTYWLLKDALGYGNTLAVIDGCVFNGKNWEVTVLLLLLNTDEAKGRNIPLDRFWDLAMPVNASRIDLSHAISPDQYERNE